MVLNNLLKLADSVFLTDKKVAHRSAPPSNRELFTAAYDDCVPLLDFRGPCQMRTPMDAGSGISRLENRILRLHRVYLDRHQSLYGMETFIGLEYPLSCPFVLTDVAA
jgi:hypothetical protein